MTRFDDARSDIAAIEADYNTAVTKLAQVETDLADLQAHETADQNLIAQLNDQITQLQALIADLERPLNVKTPVDPRPSALGKKYFITRDGTGGGASFNDGANMSTINAAIEAVGPGGEVCIVDPGVEWDWTAGGVNITTGGDANNPVTIRGSNPDGTSAVTTFVGSRLQKLNADDAGQRWHVDYDPNNDADINQEISYSVFWWNKGGRMFQLLNGANYVRLQGFKLKHFEYAVFMGATQLLNPEFIDIELFDVREGFFQDSGQEIVGLYAQGIKAVGYSKRIFRFKGTSHNWLIIDFEGDSGRQRNDEFANFLAAEDTAHGLHMVGLIAGGRYSGILERHDDREFDNTKLTWDETQYWEGDSISTERGNRDITLENITARGNTDRGFDLKSTNTLITGCELYDNKINLAAWGEITVENSRIAFPRKRGGTGPQAMIQIVGATSATATPPGAKLTIRDSIIEYTAEAANAPYRVETGPFYTFVQEGVQYVNCTKTAP